MEHQDHDISERNQTAAIDFLLPVAAAAQMVDVFQLTGGRSDLAVAFLEDVIRQQLSFALSRDFKSARWAFETRVEAQNRRRLLGGHWLWFGFPLVWIPADGLNRLAPLFLWPLRLSAPTEADEAWVLTSEEGLGPRLNPKLDRVFREKMGWEPEARWRDAYRGEPLNKAKIAALVSGLVDQLHLKTPSQSLSISPWTGYAALNPEAGPQLHWSALIGLFPPGTPDFGGEPRAVETAPASPYPRHPFGLLERDPWQETAFQLSQANQGVLIQGNYGSGKSSLLGDLLINALSSGLRCLVLSERLEGLRALQHALTEQGLEKLVLLLQGTKDEPELVLQLMRANAKSKKTTTFPAHTFEQQLRELLDQKQDLDRTYRAANKKVLGPYTWTQLTGLYLAANRSESKALLASQLNIQDFDFGYEKFRDLCEKLARSQQLFARIRTLSHPLTVLNAGIFVHQDIEEAKAFIQAKIEEFSEQGTALQHRYILGQNDYGDQLVENYEQFYRLLNDQILSLREKLLTYRQQYGKDPLESTRTTLRLYARFSERFRKTLAAKDDLAAGYRRLEQTHQQYAYLHHEFLPAAERHLLGRLSDNLERLQEQLKVWREQLGNTVQEELMRLSSKTANNELSQHETIAALEQDLDLWVEAFNNSGLFQLPVENKNLTLPRQQRFLEEVLEKLDRLRQDMRDFDRFYEWQRYWFGLPAEARRIITALVKVKPEDWAAAFSSWYLHHQLLQSAEPHLPETPSPTADFVQRLQHWRRLLIGQILDSRQESLQAVLQRLKRSDRSVYDLLGPKKATPLREVNQVLSSVISDFFPILLASPSADYTFLTDRRYDYVLIDDAHLIDMDLIRSWAKLGDKVVLFHNPEAGGPDLSSWLRRQAWPKTRLQGQYPPERPRPRVEVVEGRYDSRQWVNEEEALLLLDLLNKIEVKPQRTLPKVGIVCLTRAQRNLVIQYLDRIKRQRMSGFERIQQLERNGLVVFTPDELPAVVVDQLLISCTYGRSGAADQLTPDYQQLDQFYLPGLAPLLASRSTEQTILLHSIPDEDLSRLSRENAGRNSGQLAQWILESSAAGAPGPQPAEERPVHPLASEVGWYIADQVRTDRLAFSVPCGGAMLPLTVSSAGSRGKLAVLLNGFVAETTVTNYEWEQQLRDRFEAEGYDLCPLWSVHWWKRPEEEALQFSRLVNSRADEEE